MKHHFIKFTSISLLALTACAEGVETPPETPQESEISTNAEPATIPASTPRENGVYVSNFWAGEYPNGFAVLNDNVTISARSRMHKDAPRDVTCSLLKNANYHPWNFVRSEADALEFKSVIQKTTITMTADLDIQADSEGEDATQTLTLKADDTLTYLSYIGEGFFIAEYNSKEYYFQEGELGEAAIFEESKIPDQQWINVECADEAGTRAWVLYKDVLDQEGITGTQIAAYGEAFDLDHPTMENPFAP